MLAQWSQTQSLRVLKMLTPHGQTDGCMDRQTFDRFHKSKTKNTKTKKTMKETCLSFYTAEDLAARSVSNASPTPNHQNYVYVTHKLSYII